MRDLLFEADGSSKKSPEAAAQEHMRPVLPKRFYKDVTIDVDKEVAEQDEHQIVRVLLDGRKLKTPAKQELALPNEAAGELVAAEWQAQETEINPAKMPITRLANTAIDGIAADPQAVLEDIVRFASNDLLCYRATHPENLVALQRESWDPILDWITENCGARFEVTEGISSITQPREAVSLFSAKLSAHASPLKLACLHTMTSLSGSGMIAFAIAEGFLDADTAWKAAHIDEDFNISQWGEDYEAGKRRENRFEELNAAVTLFKVL